MAEMYGITQVISKEMADRLLSTNPRNRSIKKMKVEKYKRDIILGRFEITHQGIGIDEYGKLIDGHHRLKAISETGVPVKLFVVYNAVESRYIDQGANRTDRDGMYMSGMIEKDSIEYNQLVFPLCSFIILRNLGEIKNRMSGATEKDIVYKKFSSVIDPVICIAKKYSEGKMKASPILYAMACAINSGVPAEKVEQWYKVATTGDFYFENDDEATRAGRSILLFKNLMEIAPTKGYDRSAKDEIVKKAESSIYHFINNDQITKVYGSLFFKDLVLTNDEIIV